MPDTLYNELVSKFKLRRRDGEDFETYAKRATDHINKLSDADWKRQSESLQKWGNATLEAREEKKELPELEGFPEDDGAAEADHDPETGEVIEDDTANDNDGAERDPVEDDDDEEEEDGEEASAEDPEEPSNEETVDEEADSEQEAEPEDEAKPKKGNAKKDSKPAAAAKKASAPKPKKGTEVKKAAKATPAAARQKASEGSRTRIGDNDTIKLLVKTNPYRPDSIGHKAFAKIKDGMTVKAFATAVSKLDSARAPTAILRFDIKKGHIEVVAKKSA